MTRKDYKAIAKAISELPDPVKKADLVVAIGWVLAEGNERFDQDKFKAACYAEK